MKLLEGKTALITGAARGIGKAIALKFASEGCNIAFTDLNIDDNALKTQSEIESYGVKAKGYASNAANFEETHKVVEEIAKEFGRIDILVNNAGITKDTLIMRMSDSDFEDVLRVNAFGAFYMMREVSRVMLKARRGRIINISSVVGLTGNAGQVNYSASKAAVIGMTKSLARELASRKITVNAVAPGFIATEMIEAIPEEKRKAYVEQIPLKRFGSADEVANIVSALASDQFAYVTGQVICVDGGMAM